jgi:hypothetical protein
VISDTYSGKSEQLKETGTVIKGISYFITFFSTPNEYPIYLPTVQKIIDSFQIGR